MLHYVERPIGA